MSYIVLILFAALTLNGCLYRPYFKPPGENIASCEGKIRFKYTGTTKFRVDVYSHGGTDLSFWFSLPRRGVSYRRIEDFDIENGCIGIETVSPKRVYIGEIVGESLKFKGDFAGFSGMFELNFE